MFSGTYHCKYHGECRHKWSECSKNPANGGDYHGDTSKDNQQGSGPAIQSQGRGGGQSG